ncbi:MAG: response regulator [Gammaproteobacteria bacterium]|nr:response regulator [Gammaproteobacteria bacterium]
MYRILIVDDEENIVNSLKRSLRKISEWEIETFTSGTEALRRAEGCTFDLFISDFRMPGLNGVEFLSQVKKIQPNAARIILSGYTDLEALVGAINEAEIFRFINKPWNDYEFILTIEQALKYKDMLTENLYLANQVREQSEKLSENEQLLSRLEQQSPGITKVNWSDDGSIILEDD